MKNRFFMAGNRAGFRHRRCPSVPRKRNRETSYVPDDCLPCLIGPAHCLRRNRLDEAPEDLGAFQARVTHVYTEKALQWPLSRDADHAEWDGPD